jgi:hypothetical protein
LYHILHNGIALAWLWGRGLTSAVVAGKYVVPIMNAVDLAVARFFLFFPRSGFACAMMRKRLFAIIQNG